MVEFAYGPTGHNVHYGAVHNPWALDQHHRRFVVGIGLGRRGTADLRALGSDTAARSGCPRISAASPD